MSTTDVPMLIATLRQVAHDLHARRDASAAAVYDAVDLLTRLYAAWGREQAEVTYHTDSRRRTP